jgi:hypothetical protein
MAGLFSLIGLAWGNLDSGGGRAKVGTLQAHASLGSPFTTSAVTAGVVDGLYPFPQNSVNTEPGGNPAPDISGGSGGGDGNAVKKSGKKSYYANFRSFDSGRTWHLLPETRFNSMGTMPIIPSIRCMSNNGLKVIGSVYNPAEMIYGALYTSWSEEVSSPSELELIYVDEGLWKSTSSR